MAPPSIHGLAARIRRWRHELPRAFFAVAVRSPELDVALEAGVRAVKSTPLINKKGRMLGIISVHHREARAHIDSDIFLGQRGAMLNEMLRDAASPR